MDANETRETQTPILLTDEERATILYALDRLTKSAEARCARWDERRDRPLASLLDTLRSLQARVDYLTALTAKFEK